MNVKNVVAVEPAVSALSRVESTDIVPIDWTVGDGGRVNARELWTALGSRQDFSTWFKAKASNFTPNEDFGIFHNSVEYSERGRGKPKKDFWLTVDIAKEVCMMEQTETGRRIRKYFITAEKAYRQQLSQPVLSDFDIMCKAVQISSNRIRQLESKVEQVEADNQKLNTMIRNGWETIKTKYLPKVNAFDKMKERNSSDGAIDVGTFINSYRLNKYIGRNNLFELLRDWGWVRTGGKKSKTRPTQYAQQVGWLQEHYSAHEIDGRVYESYTSWITDKGCAHIMERLVKEGYIPTSDVELL
jgi:anti-repressor protein